MNTWHAFVFERQNIPYEVPAEVRYHRSCSGTMISWEINLQLIVGTTELLYPFTRGQFLPICAAWIEHHTHTHTHMQAHTPHKYTHKHRHIRVRTHSRIHSHTHTHICRERERIFSVYTPSQPDTREQEGSSKKETQPWLWPWFMSKSPSVGFMSFPGMANAVGGVIVHPAVDWQGLHLQGSLLVPTASPRHAVVNSHPCFQ